MVARMVAAMVSGVSAILKEWLRPWFSKQKRAPMVPVFD
jgi:lipopolysaccharide export LptBFGC system permease protein LptF